MAPYHHRHQNVQPFRVAISLVKSSRLDRCRARPPSIGVPLAVTLAMAAAGCGPLALGPLASAAGLGASNSRACCHKSEAVARRAFCTKGSERGPAPHPTTSPKRTHQSTTRHKRRRPLHARTDSPVPNAFRRIRQTSAKSKIGRRNREARLLSTLRGWVEQHFLRPHPTNGQDSLLRIALAEHPPKRAAAPRAPKPHNGLGVWGGEGIIVQKMSRQRWQGLRSAPTNNHNGHSAGEEHPRRTCTNGACRPCPSNSGKTPAKPDVLQQPAHQTWRAHSAGRAASRLLDVSLPCKP